jgi:hypothetical protein
VTSLLVGPPYHFQPLFSNELNIHTSLKKSSNINYCAYSFFQTFADASFGFGGPGSVSYLDLQHYLPLTPIDGIGESMVIPIRRGCLCVLVLAQ